MKITKKKVFVSALAVCIVAILSMGSLAWFTDSDDATNKFYVADSTQIPDKIFSIDLMEGVDTDGDGKKDASVAYNGDKKNVGWNYNNIKPGDKLVKEPWIKNTGSYEQWVRIKVTLDNGADWQAIANKHNIDLEDMFGDFNNSWKRVDTPEFNSTEDTITYVYYLDAKVAPTKMRRLFSYIIIPEELDKEDMAMFENGKFNINLVAEAVQADNTGDTAVEGFTTCKMR